MGEVHIPKGTRFGRASEEFLQHRARATSECETVFCSPDPSPHPVRYERQGDGFRYSGNYHARPRRAGSDVDVCMGGAVAVSEIQLFES